MPTVALNKTITPKLQNEMKHVTHFDTPVQLYSEFPFYEMLNLLHDLKSSFIDVQYVSMTSLYLGYIPGINYCMSQVRSGRTLKLYCGQKLFDSVHTWRSIVFGQPCMHWVCY